VLAHLILRANHTVGAEQLVDGLWGDEPPETARNTLQTYVYRLRKVLGGERLEGRARPPRVDPERADPQLLTRHARALPCLEARFGRDDDDRVLACALDPREGDAIRLEHREVDVPPAGEWPKAVGQGVPGASPHHHRLTHRDGAEIGHVLRKPPGNRSLAADHSSAGDSRDERDLHTATGARIAGWWT